MSVPKGLSGFSYPQRIHRNLYHCKFSQPNKMTTPKLCTLAGSTWHYPQHRNKVQKNCSKKHASWPKRGEVTSQPTQSTSPGSTPSYPPPQSTYYVKYKQLTSPHISTVAPSSRSLSTINIGVVPGTTMVHGILSFLAE